MKCNKHDCYEMMNSLAMRPYVVTDDRDSFSAIDEHLLQPMEVIDVVLERLNLSGYFAAKFSGAEMTFSKPHPEIFLRSAQHANCEPGECLVIEDSENGVRSAKDAGMKCIGFLNPNSGVQNLNRADLIIKSFKELNTGFIKSI